MGRTQQKKAIRHRKNLHVSNWWNGLGVAVIIAFGSYIYWYFTPSAPQLPSPPLKVLAASHHVELGMLTYPDEVNTEPFSQIVQSQYDFVTIDGALHWDQMRPSPGTYSFSQADKVVNFAQRNHLKVQVHHLVWDEADSLPMWLKNGNYSESQLYQILHDHITTVMTHYKGKVQEYTVVNEPFTRAAHMYGLSDWWAEHLGRGTTYIDKSFIWAHEADSHATLILNDFANEVPGKIADAQYAYMKSAKARGIPIDAIGMQLHVDASQPPSLSAMTANMQRFGALGYKVYITEFDVDTHLVKASPTQKEALEAKITADVVHACIDSKACASFDVFGIRNPTLFEGWQLYWQRHRQPRSYLLDSRFQPTPSYRAFYDTWAHP